MIEVRNITKTDAISSKGKIAIFKSGQCERASGVNLIEVMSATAILTITVIGISGYRYCSCLNARLAEEQIAAARLAQLLCGSWAGVEGDESFDLKSSLCSDLTVETLETSNGLPADFTSLGRYRITINGVAYDCTLAWNNISPELRALWIRVGWYWREENPSNSDNALEKSFTLITYISS